MTIVKHLRTLANRLLTRKPVRSSFRSVWDNREGYGWQLPPRTPVKSVPQPSPYDTPLNLPHWVQEGTVITVPRRVYDDVYPTAVLPVVPRGGVVTSRIAHSLTDDMACDEACRAVLAGDWDAALAGLLEYNALNPVAV